MGRRVDVRLSPLTFEALSADGLLAVSAQSLSRTLRPTGGGYPARPGSGTQHPASSKLTISERTLNSVRIRSRQQCSASMSRTCRTTSALHSMLAKRDDDASVAAIRTAEARAQNQQSRAVEDDDVGLLKFACHRTFIALPPCWRGEKAWSRGGAWVRE